MVELIVVIAIIGILAGMMLPRFGNFTKEASSARAQSDIKALAEIVEIYNAKHGARPTIGTATSTGVIKVTAETSDGDADGTIVFSDTDAGSLTINNVGTVTVTPGTAALSNTAQNIDGITSIKIEVDGTEVTWTILSGTVE